MRNFGISRKYRIINIIKQSTINITLPSWHEIGASDLPAIIDHILKVTGQKQLFYIGHSQGTTVFFVLASERPEYNNRIRLMLALSPIAYVSHMVSPVFNLVVKFFTTTKVRIIDTSRNTMIFFCFSV